MKSKLAARGLGILGVVEDPSELRSAGFNKE